MTFKELKQKIKEEQKQLAQLISRGKYLRKPHRRTDDEVTKEDRKNYFYSSYYEYFKVTSLGDDYRHRHIVYCTMFNNTPYEQIEQPAEDNRPSQARLDNIRKLWEKELDEEVIRDCA